MNEYELSEELNRKVLETIYTSENKMIRSEISKRDYALVLDTINSIALGLYDRDVAQVVTSVLSDIRTSNVMLREVFYREDNGCTYTVEYQEGSSEVRTYRSSSEGVKLLSYKNYDDEAEGVAMAKDLFDKSVDLMTSSYTPLSEAVN